MIRLLILTALGVAIGLLISKLFFKRQNDDVIEGEVIDADVSPNKPSLLPVLLLGVVIAGVVFFVLPRFGISVMGLLQKAIAFLPLTRGFLPFWSLINDEFIFLELFFWRVRSVAPVYPHIKKELRKTVTFWNNGDSGKTRTPNLLIRSQLLYPVELRALRSALHQGGSI